MRKYVVSKQPIVSAVGWGLGVVGWGVGGESPLTIHDSGFYSAIPGPRK